MANCQNCNRPFLPKRRDAKFCSNNCRAAWSNNTRRTPMTQQPSLFPASSTPPVQNPVMMIPQTPVSGLGNINSTDYWYQRAQSLENDNRQMAERIRKYETEEAVRTALESQPEEVKGLGFIDTLGTVAKEHPELAEMGINLLGKLFSGGMGSNAGSDQFTGVEASKKEKLQALVEIAKTLPDEILEMILELSGKAALNPSQFMQGVQEATVLSETPQNNSPFPFQV
jgi:hypothetical protein